MNRIKYLAIILVLAIAMLACNVSVNNPLERVSIGSMDTYPIEVPAPEESDEIAEVVLRFGAGQLELNPGSDENLISGTATYNVNEFQPEVTVDGSKVLISQELEEFNLLPAFGGDVENRWDLELGTFPMDLDISAGGYQGEFEFGGLALHSLRIAEGAASTDVAFSELNQVEMDSLRYDTGASSATLSGLANANFREMDFRSGAGEYTLDFSGDLQRDADVSIKSGLSSVTIIVSRGTQVSVEVESGLANIDPDGDWSMTGGRYSLPGDGPELTISVEMGAGNLELRER
jgi:hypothetical protein